MPAKCFLLELDLCLIVAASLVGMKFRSIWRGTQTGADALLKHTRICAEQPKRDALVVSPALPRLTLREQTEPD